MKYIKILLILLFTISIANAADFSYRLDLTKTLKEDQSYNCTLNYDNEQKTFDISKTGKYTKTVKNDFEDNLSLRCTASMEALNLYVYNEDRQVDKLKTTKKSRIAYNLDYYELDIEIKSDDNECTLNYDGILEDFKIEEKEHLEKQFFKTFSINCIDNVDSIEVKVFNKQNQKLFYDLYENTHTMNYNAEKSISKDYNVILYFYDSFEKSNKCVLTLDNDKKLTKTFTNRMKGKELYFESKVGSMIQLACANPINKTLLFVDDREWSKEVFKNQYNQTKTININIAAALKPKAVIEEIIDIPKIIEPVVVPKVKPVIKKETTPTKNITQKENKTVVPKPTPKQIEKEKSWWQKLWGWLFN